MDYQFFSVLPILAVLFIAFWKKQVFLALIAGLALSSVIIGVPTGNFTVGINAVSEVFTSVSTAQTTFFILLTGSIMTAANRSGGVEGLVRYCTEKRSLVKSPVAAQMISAVLGLVLFVDGTSSITVTAMAGKPFFKKYGVPKEKLAFISNSTGSAIAWLVPFGSACAVLTAFLTPVAEQLGIPGSPFQTVMSSVVFQFYTLALLVILFFTILTGREWGPMKRSFTESAAAGNSAGLEYETQLPEGKEPKARNMVFPIVFLVAAIFLLLLLTGEGNLAAGDGSFAVFTAGVLTVIVTGAYYVIQGITTVDGFIGWCIDGMKSMFDLVLILALAYAFSATLGVLNTAGYLAQFAGAMPRPLFMLAGLVLSACIAYATGTSGGTASLLVPILVPLAYQIGVPVPYILGVIISGAVFGDQSSPISDSVILTSTVTDVPIMDHVRTQTPYTLCALGAALVGYAILGFTI